MTAPAPAKTVAQSTPLSANASTGVATLPSGLTDGQLLLLYIAFNHSSGTVTVSSITGGSGDSWTQVDTNTSSTNLTGRCYQRTATAATDSSAAITVTYSAGTNNVAAIEIWPVGTVVDQHTTKVNASSTTEAYNAVTPSNDAADYTIIGAVALRTTSANNGRTSTPGGSYTEQAEIGNTVSGANNLSLESKYLQLTGGGNAAQTPTSGTASGACTQVAITLAIKAGSVSETLNPAVTVSTALTPSIADTLAPATTVATTLTPADRTETLAPAVQVSTALTPSIDATLAPAVAVTTTLTPAALTATLGPAVAVTTALTPAALTETLAPHTTVTTALTPSIDATLTPQVTVSTFLDRKSVV